MGCGEWAQIGGIEGSERRSGRMKMNVKWVWRVSGLVYVGVVVSGYGIYEKFYENEN